MLTSFRFPLAASRRIQKHIKAPLRPLTNAAAANVAPSFNQKDQHNNHWKNAGGSSGDFKRFYRPAALLGMFLGSFFLYGNEAENCGIVGVVGTEDASGFILEGLTILRNRGYDSAGLATINGDDELYVTKFASRDTTADSIDLVRANAGKHFGHFTGIGHTRWATHGGKTDFNAHPHTDQHHRVAIIHNGTINNSYDLKKELLEKGIKFNSETDTEVIAQLIGLNLDKGMDTKDAVAHALTR